MEIEDIRKDLNDLLDNVVEHSTKFSDERPIPSLEISFVLAKINKMQETLSVLRYLLEEQETISKQRPKTKTEIPVTQEVQEEIEEQPVIVETIIESSQKVDETLAENHEQSPIPKLIDALTLNDRYLYANELFNKDMNSFNELVKSIDNSSSLNEAKETLSALDWDDENEHVISFYNLVERRFIS